MRNLTYGLSSNQAQLSAHAHQSERKTPSPRRNWQVWSSYQIPCQCGKVYVGETQRRLETRIKEHRDACNKGDTWKSAIAEHQWDQQHQVDWDATRVLDRAARPVQLKVKEALHIKKMPANNRLNRDGGYELPGCWMKKLGGGDNRAI